MNSIVIQKQVISEVYDFIEALNKDNIQLQWADFVEKSVGDDENMLAYLKLLNTIQTMDVPLDLAAHFAWIRGQFANSEDKFIGQLIDAGHEEGEDFQKITVENDRIQEELLFFSYRCIKTFVLDKKDQKMLRALLIGEEIYRMYKIYSVPFAKKPSIKTHWMAVEQIGGFDGSLETYTDDLNNPKAIIKIFTGNAKSMAKQMEEIKFKPKKWGRIIIPASEAVYMNAVDDTKRLIATLKESVFDDYKITVKARIKKETQSVKNPTGIKWGFKALTSCIIIDPTCKDLDYEDIVNNVKEFWLNTLAQAHTPLQGRSHEEYLELVERLETDRVKRFGYFSAIKYNAIHVDKLLTQAKMLAKEQKNFEKKAKAAIQEETQEETESKHGYATAGSEAEEKSASEEVEEVEEEKPKKQAKSKSKKKEEKPKAPAKRQSRNTKTKGKAKKVKVVEEDDEDYQDDENDDDDLSDSVSD